MSIESLSESEKSHSESPNESHEFHNNEIE